MTGAAADPWTELHGALPTADRIVRAPGRVNLIGEHTDYSGGLVLPVAIGREVRIASESTDDGHVRLRRLDDGSELSFSLDDPGSPTGEWIDYVAGVAIQLRAAGVASRSVRGVIGSTLPEGAGLSSSAAIELAAAWTLSAPAPPPMPPIDVALAAQRAENDWVGVQCGLMDQATVALARAGHALLLDCRSLETRHVAVHLPGHVLVLIDSGSRRRLSASAYNARRTECSAAVEALRVAGHPIDSLRDVTPEMLNAAPSTLDPLLLRRVRHVVTENRRVVTAVDALEAGDATTLGRLLRESHASLRDDYEVSSPQLDAVVEIADQVPGLVGARLTGAGFGGSVIALAQEAALPALNEALETQYPPRTGLQAKFELISPSAGAGLA